MNTANILSIADLQLSEFFDRDGKFHNNNNNIQDNVYGAVIVAEPL